jgi:hypothetical protein
MAPRRILSGIAAALLAAVVVVCLATPAAAQTVNQIQPFVTCVDFLPSWSVRAHFGYVSTYPTDVTLPIGLDNYMTPGIINRGQPTVFEPGFHDRAFSIEWQPNGASFSRTWVVQQTATAPAMRSTALLCGARSRGDWDANATYVEGDLVRYNGSLFVNWVATGWGCPDTPANGNCWWSYSPSPPVISDIPDQTTNENSSIKNIPFTLKDADNIWNLTVLAASSDTTLLPLDGIVFQGGGANRMVTVTPAPNRTGTVVVTLYVTDGVSVATESFVVNVL